MDKNRSLYRLPEPGDDSLRASVGRILVIWILGVCVLSFLGSTAAAWWFGFSPALGEPAAVVEVDWRPALWAAIAAACALGLGLSVRGKVGQSAFFLICAGLCAAVLVGPVYAPFAVFRWWWEFRGADVGAPLGWFAVAVVAAAVLSVPFAGFAIAKAVKEKDRKPDTHGSARWAETKDVEAAGLFGPEGVVLGAWVGGGPQRYLRSGGESHIFIQGPPGSGKTVGCVIPTLLTFRGNALIHDPKGELWDATAGYRSQMGHRCIRFDPTSVGHEAARNNPLLEVRSGALEMADAQRLADLLASPEAGDGGGGGNEEFFQSSASELIAAALLHILYAEPVKTLAGVVGFLSHPKLPQKAVLLRMINTKHDPEYRFGWKSPVDGKAVDTHPQVASIASSLLSRGEKELSSVFSTAITRLRVYRDPVLASHTSCSDFRFGALGGDQPVSVYMTIPPSDLPRIRPLIRLVISQLVQDLTKELRPDAGDRTVLIMIDEFPLLGRMAFLRETLGVLRGYGIRVVFVVQSLAQLQAVYTKPNESEVLITSCDDRVTYATNDNATAEYFSKQSGVRTVHQTKRDRRGGRLDLMMDKQTLRDQEHQRPLVYPDEILRLPKSDVLLIGRGSRPMRGVWVRSWEDEELAKRLAVPAPRVSDVLESDETFWEGLGDYANVPTVRQSLEAWEEYAKEVAAGRRAG